MAAGCPIPEPHVAVGFDDPMGIRLFTAATGWAWGLCWLMFASTVLNYMDRQTVSLLREPIGAAFAITAEADFGWVLAAFYLTYALFQVPAGYLVDRWDLRWSYAAAVAWWSLAAAATAVAPSLCVLIACRILLGVGESFNWPCALRVTARALPPSDRSLGNGIFNSGAALGAVVTPVVVTLLTKQFGWRASFVVIGAAGFVWVALRASLHTNWIELVVALLVAGIGISMALPTVPTAVLSAVAPQEMGKASGINYMAQRFGAVFAIAIGSTVFGSYGGFRSPAAVTHGFEAALWACAVFAGLGALAATAMSARTKPVTDAEAEAEPEPTNLPIAA